MARYLDVHPTNPQPRLIRQVVELVRSGGVIAYPTDHTCLAALRALGRVIVAAVW